MMKSGKYYVGDLCYVMTDDEWSEFCDLTIKGNDCLNGEFTFADGRKFATYGTKYGDGLYPASNGKMLSVDAGLIGCFAVGDIRAEKYDDIEELGMIVDFESDFCTSVKDGVIRFGDITVDTDGETEEFYFEDEEC
jgi:hypothetical protein